MASLHPQNVFLHLTGHWGINLVVLVIIMLLNGEDFLICEQDVFVAFLSVPMEEMLCSHSGFRRIHIRTVLIVASSLTLLRHPA
jgi:hypothetical protein